MSFLQLNNISLAFGDRDILKGTDLRVGNGDRIALSGANGSGKSSLLKIAAEINKPDSGDISKSPGARITYLPQTGLEYSGSSLSEEAEKAFSYVHRMISEKKEIENRLADIDESDPSLNELLHSQHDLEESIASSGYYLREQRISEVLSGLGFSDQDKEKETGSFSGGWQMRIALAKALLTNPDLLLLDEPTNYLDLEARDWLQEFLSSFKGGIILVSHDRHFLDYTCNRVAELFLARLRLYTGNYSAYLKQREKELEQLQKAYTEQQAEIGKLESFIERFRYNSSKAPLVQSRIKQLEKIEPIELPESMKHVHFSFPSPPHSGKQVLGLREVSKSYGEHTVFRSVELDIERGERLALVGRNGAGKSTLMRILAGADTDYDGTLKPGTGVRIGYFDQNVEKTLIGSHSIYDEIERETPTELIPSLRGLLGAFLFRGDDIYKPLDVLSGGEKSRLALLKLLLNPVNLLILDEPTNHLDLQTKEVLLDVLSTYEGTLVFVSHDRYFLEKLATRIFEIENCRATNYPGDYLYYRSIKERYSDEQTGSGQSTSGDEKEKNPEKTASQLHREELKTHQASQRRMVREEEALLESIDSLETTVTGLHEELSKPEIYSSADKAQSVQARLDKTQAELESAHQRWEEVSEALTRIESVIAEIQGAPSK